MEPKTSVLKKIVKILITVVLCVATPIVLLYALILFAFGMSQVALLLLFIPALIPAVWVKRKKLYLIPYVCLLLAIAIPSGVQWGIEEYKRSITIDVTPNINVHEYLPFVEDSKIVKIGKVDLVRS